MNKEEIRRISLELEKDIEKIKNSILKLQEDIECIEKGDDNGPYWNGDHAYQAVKTALLQIEHDALLVKDLENKMNYIHSLEK